MSGKKVVVAQMLQQDVDSLLKTELAACDELDSRFGDAFLIQVADTLHHLMASRSSLKKYAGKMDDAANYFKQIYPKEFVKGLTEDHCPKKKKKKK